MGDKIYLKIKEGYSNQFITTIKGHTFYKEKVTEFDGSDGEVDTLLAQGLLVVVEDIAGQEIVDSSNIVKNDMDETNEEYKGMLKEDKQQAKEQLMAQFDTEEEVKVEEKASEKDDKETKTVEKSDDESTSEKDKI